MLESCRAGSFEPISWRLRRGTIGSVSERDKLAVRCPECGADIAVDAATGTVLHHKKVEPERREKDFDELFAGLDASKSRAEDVFKQELSAQKDRDRLMEEKFKEAMRRAEEDPDDGPPLRPWDLD